MYDKSDMRLHSYLEQVVGSKASVKMIRTLLTRRGKVYTVRGLAEGAGVSPSEAALVLKRLEDTGVLKLQPIGRAYLVTLNEQSFVLKRVIEPLFNVENATFEKLAQLLKKCLGKKQVIKSAYLFGSTVRGDERDDSDIDLLVISNDFEQASVLVAEAQERTGAAFNKSLSPLILSEREILARTKKESGFLESVASEYFLVCGRDILGDLKNKI